MKELLEDVLLVLNSLPNRKLRGKDWTTYDLAKRVEEKLEQLPSMEQLLFVLEELKTLEQELKEIEK